MPSIGPFDFTEAEVVGLEFLRQEDERQLRKTGLHATWSGRVLTVKTRKIVFRSRKGLEDIESRSSSFQASLPTI
ncbi:MAG TPA: hypothetical protein VE177_04110 [Candidatus Binatus sp.]|nr:hypothetical protein [Candidatus Binatus sp.]